MSTQPTQPLVTADLFCGKCAYNLRGQPVSLEQNTQLHVICCPECGAYHPTTLLASSSRWHLWFDKSLALLSIAWVLGIALISFAGLFFEFAVALAGLEMATSIYTSIEDAVVAVVFFVLSPLGQGLLLSITLTNSDIRARVRWPLLRSALFFLAAVVTIVVIYFNEGQKPSDQFLLAAAGLLSATFVHAVLGVIGGFIGRPIVMALCRNFLPKSIQPYALRYWET